MPRRFNDRYFSETTPVSPETFNPIIGEFDRAIAGLEEFRDVNWLKQVDLFNANALKRVNDAVKPLVDRMQTAVQGGFLVAQTDDLVEIIEGEDVNFFIPEAARVAFRPTPFLAVLAPDEREDWAIGRVTVYNEATGLLTVEILHLNGSGAERTGWTVAASSGVVEAVYQWMMETKAARDATIAAGAIIVGAAEAARDIAVEAKNLTQAAAILIAGGPVSSVNTKTGAVTGMLEQAGAQDIIGLKTIVIGDSNDTGDRLQVKPSDYGTGKPLLRITKMLASSTTWDIGLFDGVNNAGTLNFDVAALTKLGVALATVSDVADASELKRVAVTGARAADVADFSKFLDASGSFTIAFDPVATLGDGWWCFIRNAGTGNITLDPNGAETVDGLASYIMYPGEVRLFQCDGTALRSIVIKAGSVTFTSSDDFIWPPGWAGADVQLHSAGGGGARPNAGSDGGAGGGGGAWDERYIANPGPGTSVDVEVGAGGLGATTNNTAGSPGGNTSFGADFMVLGGEPGSGTIAGRGGCFGPTRYAASPAYGGAGGNANQSAECGGGGGANGAPNGSGPGGATGGHSQKAGAGGGAGTINVSGNGAIITPGGKGGVRQHISNPSGAAGSPVAGGNGADGVNPGDGGAGGTYNNAGAGGNGGNGAAPGGGGGGGARGSTASGNGGNGARGEATIVGRA